MSSLLLLLIAAASLTLVRPQTYTDRYDSLDLSAILANRRLSGPYIKCLIGQGKCSPQGRELKSHVKEALENACRKCTARQQAGTRQVIAYLINHEPQYWRQLTDVYDPRRQYVSMYERELRTLDG